MLKRTKIIDLLKSETTQDQVLVKGWVKTRRDAKDFSFIELNDGSCLKNLQIIAQNNLPNYNEIKTISTQVALLQAVQDQWGKDSVKMLELFTGLNPDGQKKALNQLEDLSEIPKYRKDDNS